MHISENELSKILEKIKEVGRFLKLNKNRAEILLTKKNGDFSINLDVEAENELVEFVGGLFPSHSIDSEESATINKKSDYIWVIDPLDGTKNFVRDLPFYCVSMALKFEDEAVFGAVYIPETDDLYYAVKGNGAFRITSEGKTKLRFDNSKKLEESHLHIEFPANDPSNLPDEFKDLLNSAYRLRATGSGAIGLCYTARNGFDGHIDLSGTTKECDVLAGLLICTEAGATINETNLGGANILAVGTVELVNYKILKFS